MATLREVIARLETHEYLLDRQVAFTFYSAEDVELTLDDLDTDLSADEVWNEVVDQIQAELDDGYCVEVLANNLTDVLGQRFGWRSDAGS